MDKKESPVKVVADATDQKPVAEKTELRKPTLPKADLPKGEVVSLDRFRKK